MQIDEAEVLEMPAEVAFVPASERTTLAPPSSTSVSASTTRDPLTGDTIVVVGRKKDKKAKKDKDRSQSQPQPLESSTPAASASTTPSTLGMGELSVDNDEDLTGFDFNSVPNILDDDEDVEGKSVAGRGQKRGKKQVGSDKVKKAKGSQFVSFFLFTFFECGVAGKNLN